METLTHPQVNKSVPVRAGFKRLLVAIDFSAATSAALSHALLLARLFHAKMTLIHAIESRESSGADSAEVKAAFADATEELEKVRLKVEMHGIQCIAVCRIGSPSDVIVQAASENNSDLLILGGAGFKALGTSELGSTADFIMRSMPCPTLTIGNQVAASGGHVAEFRRLLFASSLRSKPGKALDLTKELAILCNASVDVVHVLNRKNGTSVSVEEFRHREDEIVAALNRANVAAIAHLLRPPDGKAIIEFAQRRKVGLIVFGIEHKAIAPSARGMLAEVVQCAPCPVLTVPGPA